MNKFLGIGRATDDPEVRYSQGETPVAIASVTIAFDRRFKKEGQQSADFLRCKAFGKTAEFFEKYVTKGTKLAIEGRVETGSYTNKDGNKVYTTDIVIENLEFAESKKSAEGNVTTAKKSKPSDGFMDIPDGIDEELPFT